ncbi:unnamed protein product, partial [Amoebophrya sp. A120]
MLEFALFLHSYNVWVLSSSSGEHGNHDLHVADAGHHQGEATLSTSPGTTA